MGYGGGFTTPSDVAATGATIANLHQGIPEGAVPWPGHTGVDEGAHACMLYCHPPHSVFSLQRRQQRLLCAQCLASMSSRFNSAGLYTQRRQWKHALCTTVFFANVNVRVSVPTAQGCSTRTSTGHLNLRVCAY